MATIRILRPEDVTLEPTMVTDIDHEEAEENFRRAMAATENLRQFVESRDRQLFPERNLERAEAGKRRIGFIKW